MGGRVNDADKDTRGYAYVDRVDNKDNYYTEEIVYCFDKNTRIEGHLVNYHRR
jgi:hypothetical protein